MSRFGSIQLEKWQPETLFFGPSPAPDLRERICLAPAAAARSLGAIRNFSAAAEQNSPASHFHFSFLSAAEPSERSKTAMLPIT